MAKSKAKNNTVTSLVSGTIPDIPEKIWRLRPYFFEKNPGIFRFFNYTVGNSGCSQLANKVSSWKFHKTTKLSCYPKNLPPHPPNPLFFLGNVKTKNQYPWNTSFLIKPRYIQLQLGSQLAISSITLEIQCPRLPLFSGIAPCKHSSSL